MAKLRILVFLSTIIIVGMLGLIASYYARGYKFDGKTLRFTPNGILVVNSEPNGAQIYINNQLKTATNANISVSPGTYKIEVKKDGYTTWSKEMQIQKEVVTQIDAVLFPIAPSLSALTFSGVVNPVSSPDTTKVAYAILPSKDNGETAADKAGLWVTEIITFPIGFTREPKRITDGDLTEAEWVWSPDNREILLKTKLGLFLLDPTEFTSQVQRINIALKEKEIREGWRQKEEKKRDSQLANLPREIRTIFEKNASNITFSPDETKILYEATESAKIPGGLIKPLPGASTQKQTREIKRDKKYVFDIKEDRNFEVADSKEITYWLPTSRHLILPQKDKVVVIEYDGTNKLIVYSGSYIYPHAYPYSNASKLLILTNLGSADSLPNLYSLNLK